MSDTKVEFEIKATKHNRNHSLKDFDPFSPLSTDQRFSPSFDLMDLNTPHSPRDARMDVTYDHDYESSVDVSLGRNLGSADHLQGTPKILTNQLDKETTRFVMPFPFTRVSPKTEKDNNATLGTIHHKHKKGSSLIENKRRWKEVQEAIHGEASSVTTSPTGFFHDSNSCKPDSLLKHESSHKAEVISDLFLPSLTKPCPTSLLPRADEGIRTCELEPSAFQLALPHKEDILVAARAVFFLDSYRSNELVMDLATLCGFSKTELQSFANGEPGSCNSLSSCHRSVVEKLLYSCPDLIEVKAYLQSDDYEILILERQKNQFLVAFHAVATRFKKQPFALKDHQNVTVAKAYFEIARCLSPKLFAHLDNLSVESPFSDFVFAGHGTGAGVALLTSYFYAHTRVSQRVAAFLTDAPKIGLDDFRMAVHSQPNLQVIRMDNQGRRGNQGFSHAGHCIRLRQGSDKLLKAIAFKFAPDAVAPGFRTLRIPKHSSAEEFVGILENTTSWPEDFHAEDVGEGVKGVNNEKRTLA